MRFIRVDWPCTIKTQCSLTLKKSEFFVLWKDDLKLWTLKKMVSCEKTPFLYLRLSMVMHLWRAFRHIAKQCRIQHASNHCDMSKHQKQCHTNGMCLTLGLICRFCIDPSQFLKSNVDERQSFATPAGCVWCWDFFKQDWHPNQRWSQSIQKQTRLLGLQDITT